MDFRKIFDSIPEEFEKWRTRYCDELFADVIKYSNLDSTKTALEIGPGTGQATEPILKTGCSYLAIELGENLAEYTKNKFSLYDNFQIVNADFETYDFRHHQFDLVYSAATIQWIPEEIGFPKVYDILKSNGIFAMMFTRTDEKSANEPLYLRIQEIYAEYFHPETEYTRNLNYNNAEKYGFTDIECRHYHKTRELNADEYVSWISTHACHITLPEPDKSKFYAGIKEAILGFGNNIKLYDTIVLYLARKP
ncbi:methyltransferase domain-containing protein [Clostridium tagluense]|uniref:methyltransferase domain-containing protein n=1 Tax=Clostridium tagluense TaxID=360422 RepID=UPI001C6E589C|nr:class I SAM-dependent methyltransferase [Clostridium tagluense]MBW9158964.1 methyltransferase domain-containing protein [Clostridium tagluense]WLC68349.1 methyltransferase domain-containing protein [Clostridium tagluense]